MPMRAEAGPIGAPVAKQLIAKTHPPRFKRLAKKPFIQSPQSKKSSCVMKYMTPRIWKMSEAMPQ